jgi:Leucine-rich repeat (LRR) protein
MKRKDLDRHCGDDESALYKLPVEILLEILRHLGECNDVDREKQLIAQLRMRCCSQLLHQTIEQGLVATVTSYVTTETTPDWLLCSLTALTSLRSAQIHTNHLSNRVVWNMTRLRVLSLTGHRHSVTDTALMRLTALEMLNLAHNDTTRETALLPLTRLWWLNLETCRYIAGHTLSQLSSLRELSLAMNHSVTRDVRLPQQLTALDLSHNTLLDDDVLTRLPALQKLVLVKTRYITDWGLSHLTALTSLSLNNQQNVSDCSVSRLTTLQELSLTNNRLITDVSLQKLTALQTLVLHSNQAALFSSAFVLPTLQKVSVVSCYTQNYPTYACLQLQTALTELEVGANHQMMLDATFFAPLKQLRRLTYVERDCQISRILVNLPPRCIVNDHALHYYEMPW